MCEHSNTGLGTAANVILCWMFTGRDREKSENSTCVGITLGMCDKEGGKRKMDR